MKKIVNNIKIIDEQATSKRKLLRAEATPAEKLLWFWIRKTFPNLKWRRQHSLGYYIADFYCHEKKLVIELDGHHHDQGKQFEYDEIRTRFFKANAISVIRFHNEEILNQLPKVLEKIRSSIT